LPPYMITIRQCPPFDGLRNYPTSDNEATQNVHHHNPIGGKRYGDSAFECSLMLQFDMHWVDCHCRFEGDQEPDRRREDSEMTLRAMSFGGK